jgi:hypothetical protein
MIRIDVAPYDLEVPETEGGQLTRRQRRSGDGAAFEHLTGHGGGGRGSRQRAGPSDAHPGGGVQTPLLSVRIEVAWLEGNTEEWVTRNTFALDLRDSQEALEDLGRNRNRNAPSQGGDLGGESDLEPGDGQPDPEDTGDY